MQRHNIEALIKGQAETPLWIRHREERIAGIVVHDIMSLRPSTSLENIIQSVMMYKSFDLSNIPAVNYGLTRQFQQIYIPRRRVI